MNSKKVTFKGAVSEILGGRLGKRGWLTFFGILMAMVIGVAWLLRSAWMPVQKRGRVIAGCVLFLLMPGFKNHFKLQERFKACFGIRPVAAGRKKYQNAYHKKCMICDVLKRTGTDRCGTGCHPTHITKVSKLLLLM
jgi:ABC-type dipeptide/oligopeptide/nickel transport system permease component